MHRIGTLMILVVFSLFIILPLLWMLSTSLRIDRESFSLPPRFLPSPPFIWENYKTVFTGFPFLKFLMNSAVISSSAVAIQLVTSAMAAYCLAKMNFKFNNLIFMLIIAGMMVPSQVPIIPQFIILGKINLLNTRFALILTSLIYPLGVFMMRQFIITIPHSYEEAALMDGAGSWSIFTKVILPQIKPVLVVVALMHFLLVWNDFFRPLIFINSESKMTIPLGLVVLKGQFSLKGGVATILAGVIVSIIPPTLLFIFGQKQLVEGARLGGLKG